MIAGLAGRVGRRKFSEALLKGQKDGWEILKTVMKDKVREVV